MVARPFWAQLGEYRVVWRIIVDATCPGAVWWRGKGAGPDDAAEVERLVADGHKMIRDRNRIGFESSVEAVRATQLYRTLPHELGHLMHYATTAPDEEERYWQRSAKEKEAFAIAMQTNGGRGSVRQV